MPTLVTEDNVHIGMKVCKGRDWEYSPQDKGSIYGVVTRAHYMDGWCQVDWLNEKLKPVAEGFCYRIGDLDKYDLYVYEETRPAPKYQKGDKLKICNPYKCNGSGWKRFNDLGFDKIDGVGGCSFKVTEVIWVKEKQEYYYQYANGHVAEHALSLINNKKPENGTENSTEVQRPIESSEAYIESIVRAQENVDYAEENLADNINSIEFYKGLLEKL